MARKHSYLFFVLLFLGLLFSGCNATYQVKKGNYLLTQQNVVVQKGSNLEVEELNDIIKQKPNRKLLGISPFYLHLSNFGHRGRDSSRVRSWFRNIGEEPVVLDSFLNEKSRDQIELFLKKKGYYNASVKDSVRFHPKKPKCKVYYLVEEEQPYLINKIRFSIDDAELFEPIKIATQGTLMKPGVLADEYMLGDERERMTKSMKNQGYYTFSQEYVFFQIDTAVKGNKVDVRLQVKDPSLKIPDGKGGTTLQKSKHEKYRINKVFINTVRAGETDKAFDLDTIYDGDYFIIFNRKLDYKPEILLKNTFIKPLELYRLSNTEYTYKRLAGMRTFKFINIRFERLYDENNSLDCFIDLRSSPKRSFSVETEGTHRGGNLGVAAALVTRNKNTFKGAEVLEFKLKGGLEAQTLSDEDKENLETSDGNNTATNLLFNTLEYGAEVSLFIPELWVPKRRELPNYTEPKTNINVAYNYQRRPFYDRTIFNVALKYFWKLGDYHSFSFHPLDLSYIDITKDPEFQARLDEINNSLLSASYSDHLFPATRFSYIFSNQDVQSARNFTFFRVNIESSGNSLRALSNTLGLNFNPEGYYEAFNVRFAQYLKTDFDLRLYHIFNQNSDLVYRAFGGIGVPISNSQSMPFEKSFFAGGTNDQRSWTARTLGPGSISDTISFRAIDQIGDVMIGGNIEYRFNVFKAIEGAAFMDASNIWLQKKDDLRPGGDFKLDRFWKEFAVGAGLGARLNFGFFIIRLDAGLPLHDPALPEGERWIFQPKDKYNQYYGDFLQKEDEQLYQEFIDRGGYRRFRPKLNLGIGYPF